MPELIWPINPPTVEKNLKGWLCHEDHFARLIPTLEFPTVVEIGTFYGKTAHHLVSTYPQLEVLCIDPWEPYDELKNYDMNVVLQTWVANLWEYRDQVKAFRGTFLQAYMSGFIPYMTGLFYIDGAHDEVNCYLDIALAFATNAQAVICGDDFNIPGVRQAVTKFAKTYGLTYKHDTGHSSFWQLVR